MKKLFTLFLFFSYFSIFSQTKSELCEAFNFYFQKENIFEKVSGGLKYNQYLNVINFNNDVVVKDGTVIFSNIKFSPEDVILIETNPLDDNFLIADIFLNKYVKKEGYNKKNFIQITGAEVNKFNIMIMSINKDEHKKVIDILNKLFKDVKIIIR